MQGGEWWHLRTAVATNPKDPPGLGQQPAAFIPSTDEVDGFIPTYQLDTYQADTISIIQSFINKLETRQIEHRDT